jgi:hypothetical protein
MFELFEYLIYGYSSANGDLQLKKVIECVLREEIVLDELNHL